jgi:branched-chain amino acid transport system substrate-binding protein
MKSKKIFKWSGITAIFIVVCLLTFSGASAQKKEILIGAPVCISGPAAMQGLEQKWGYEQALADFMKAKGGVLVKEIGKKVPIKLILQDDESDAAKAAAAMERLIRVENVDFFLSTQYDFMVYPCAIVAEKYKKYHHASVCWPETWFQGEPFKWSTDFFGNPTEYSSVPFEIFKAQLPEAERPKRIGVFSMDNPPGEIFRKCCNVNRVKYGYPPFPVEEPFAFGAKDYSSLIMKAKAAKIDALILLGMTEDSITLTRQMKENDLSVKYYHGWAGTWASQFYEALGKDAEYVLADGFWSEQYPYPGAKELGERFRKDFKRTSVTIGLFYTQAKILFEAIEKAGTLDGAKVRDVVIKTHWKNTAMGDVKYDERGYAPFVSVALQWIKGEQKLVYPFFKGGWQVKLAPPWDKR